MTPHDTGAVHQRPAPHPWVCAVLFSLFMLRACSWAHDVWSTTGMRHTEGSTFVAALVLFGLVARHVRGTK